MVEPKLAEADPDIMPSSATFIVNTVSSMDIAFLYIYLYHLFSDIDDMITIDEMVT